MSRWHVDSLHHRCLSGEIIWSWQIILAALGSCWGQSSDNWHCIGVITKCSCFNFCTNSSLPHLVVQIMNTVQLLLVYSFWHCTNSVFFLPNLKRNVQVENNQCMFTGRGCQCNYVLHMFRHCALTILKTRISKVVTRYSNLDCSKCNGGDNYSKIMDQFVN